MADTVQEWPNRRLDIVIPSVTLTVISTMFLIWRFVYGFMQKRWFMICDYMLIIATILNITTVILRFRSTELGLGRHIFDPSLTPAMLREYSYILWITQILNIFGVAVLKWSICAYLLALKFSKIYQVVVWLSILMVTVCNFLIPAFTLFSCTPFEANWNKAIKGKCWAKGTLPLAYSQGVSNIITDLIYAVAPLIYLSTIQLSRRTQWGLRIVFLLALVGTVCSVFKTIELNALTKTKDPTWDGVNLTIWSSVELSIGILIASLPPLRKVFDNLFKKILPPTASQSRKYPSMPLYNISKPRHTTLVNDDGSERGILEDGSDKSGKIMKTVTTEVTNGQRDTQREGYSNDWGNTTIREQNRTSV